MKKLMPWVRTAAFIAGLALILGAMDYCLSPSGYVRYALHEINKKENNYDTIILGASHARSAINPEYIDNAVGSNSFNAAIPGETVDDSYYILLDAADSNDLKRVILDVDYQYWYEIQATGLFGDAFITQQMQDKGVWLKYVWDKRDSLDVRNVFAKRLSWNCKLSAVKENLRRKSTQDYRDYSINAASAEGEYVEGADGPYVGKGYFYRETFGGRPGGQDYIETWYGRENDNIDEGVIEVFDRIHAYCKENGIELICVTSPIAPSAVEWLGMEKVSSTMSAFFESRGVEYYDFNKALMSQVPRDDIHYGDLEGHMGGELGNIYSEALGRLFKDIENGNYDEKNYFYSSFEDMYKRMRSDYEEVTGTDWEGY